MTQHDLERRAEQIASSVAQNNYAKATAKDLIIELAKQAAAEGIAKDFQLTEETAEARS